ncbi:long-chain-fatty-acid--CoA ligase [Mycobacterium sp. CBMA 234]|uniref:long-chain-fatty-acid--CoA ligase n=1 Tax=Mycolicibacterium sp. CBMA 234 TaxID=1918495 RepID=UPI001390A763|nr:long-chain fatty acid--CoA ligase [Mycolicibacterium sp. CBMA 234]MUL64598.1 long-chain-fatty-acid--CoA ligase [Mycolicibacterium sp. CBMA 234]
MLNLSVLLDDSARTWPDREAVVFGDSRLSYRELDAAANQVANLLSSRGIKPGDKVALSCPNVPWFPIAYYGILKAGGVVVPLSILLKRREISYHLQDSHARAYLCFEDSPDLPMATEGFAGFHDADDCELFLTITADPAAKSRTPDTENLGEAMANQPATFTSAVTETTDTAVVLYTSGTTGRPKGAELTHANLVLNAVTAHRMLGAHEGAETFLVTVPLFHSFGQTLQMNTAFAGGGTIVLMARFDPAAAVHILQTETITQFAGVPTIYHALLAALTDDVDTARIAGNLRGAVSGGAPMPVELLRRFEARMGVKVLEGYGLSETSPAVCFTPRDGESRPGSIGKPIWGVQMKLIDNEWDEIACGPDAIGEIAIKGHPVMKGYLGKPEATAEAIRDGWFRTGDLARRDADGYYYVVDRAKEVIIRGGLNVYPRELEEVLLTHPAISLVAVIGIPHDALGEEVKAVVLKRPGDPTTEGDIVTWAKDKFAAYKYPRVVEFRTSLPMTASGKILKRQLSK